MFTVLTPPTCPLVLEPRYGKGRAALLPLSSQGLVFFLHRWSKLGFFNLCERRSDRSNHTASALQTVGSYPVVIINPSPGGGQSEAMTFTVTRASNVQPLPEGSFGKQYEDLFPPDATIRSYNPKRLALVTGVVQNMAGNPLDGGGIVTIVYRKSGYLESHRQVDAPWNGVANSETLSLIQEDAAATYLAFDGNPATILSHKSTPLYR